MPELLKQRDVPEGMRGRVPWNLTDRMNLWTEDMLHRAEDECSDSPILLAKIRDELRTR